jgi:hypothetical protein
MFFVTNRVGLIVDTFFIGNKPARRALALRDAGIKVHFMSRSRIVSGAPDSGNARADAWLSGHGPKRIRGRGSSGVAVRLSVAATLTGV